MDEEATTNVKPRSSRCSMCATRWTHADGSALPDDSRQIPPAYGMPPRLIHILRLLAGCNDHAPVHHLAILRSPAAQRTHVGTYHSIGSALLGATLQLMHQVGLGWMLLPPDCLTLLQQRTPTSTEHGNCRTANAHTAQLAYDIAQARFEATNGQHTTLNEHAVCGGCGRTGTIICNSMHNVYVAHGIPDLTISIPH